MVANSVSFRAMCGNENRLVGQSGNIGKHRCFGRIVERACDLVEHHDGCAGTYRARDGQALQLALGKPLSMLADHRVEPQGKLFHEAPCACRFTGAFNLLVGRVGSRESHIFAHRSCEQEVVLRHVGEHPRWNLGGDARCGGAVASELVCEPFGIVGAEHQLEQR